MCWKKFFEPNWNKIKITILLLVFYYFINFSTNFLTQFVASWTREIEEIMAKCMTEQNLINLGPQILISIVFMLLINFLILIIGSYITACIIMKVLEKKSKK